MFGRKKKAEPEFLFKTIHVVLADKRGKKELHQHLEDGWEVVTQTKTAFTRASDVTLRKPNPAYVPAE